MPLREAEERCKLSAKSKFAGFKGLVVKTAEYEQASSAATASEACRRTILAEN